MIVFDLICRPNSHVFEAWFGSSEDYESQKMRGLVECPLCSALDIEKAVSAPRVGMKSNQRAAGPSLGSDASSTESDKIKTMLAEMAAAQKRILAESQYVGDRFFDEARAIHCGEADDRPIHGQATSEQSEMLCDEGIMVARLPFPILDPGKEN